MAKRLRSEFRGRLGCVSHLLISAELFALAESHARHRCLGPVPELAWLCPSLAYAVVCFPWLMDLPLVMCCSGALSIAGQTTSRSRLTWHVRLCWERLQIVVPCCSGLHGNRKTPPLLATLGG